MNSNDGSSVWKRRRSREILNDDEKSNLFIKNKNKNKNKSKGKKKIVNRNIKKDYPLLRYEELPEYMKDNEYILNYYRADWSLKHAFVSLFLCHNETLNVWT